MPWNTRAAAITGRRSLTEHCIMYPMQAGMPMNTELKRATPTAVLMPIPRTTKRGMTSTGPPAPDREHTAPVTNPRISVAAR